jgi:hypothetical protein
MTHEACLKRVAHPDFDFAQDEDEVGEERSPA